MSHITKDPTQRLSLGKVHITQAAEAALQAAKVEGVPLLHRHLQGDWGNMSKQDWLQNELAVLLNLRVWSCYRLPTSQAIWIISEADRSATSILLVDSGKGIVNAG